MRTYFLRALVLLCLACSIGDRAAAQCSSENSAFKSGETLVYDLHFNWKFVWFKVGTATFILYDARPTDELHLARPHSALL